MFLIAVAAGEFAALALGVFGVAGVIFTALSWRRNDTASLVSQQDFIVNEMKALNDELRQTTDRLRAECDDCIQKLRRQGANGP
jgi:hypothetical protein